MNLVKLPENSGVYIFNNSNAKPIYIGKANNLRKRVKNHFDNKGAGNLQKKLLNQTQSIETIKIDSEIEALILEAALIKKYRPIFNSQLKDDKDYLYIKITRDTYPKVLSARKRDLVDAKVYFGPFPSAKKVRDTLKTIRKIFPYSICKPNQKRPCLYFHLGLCPGVCAGLVDKSTYKSTIRKIRLFLEGKTNSLLKALESEKDSRVRKMEYEKAAEIQRKIEALKYVTKPFRFLEGDAPLDEVRAHELSAVAKILNLTSTPKRIECYDVSNLGGNEAVGSMVVFTDGQADKDEYKRFKIKTVKGINDVAMIKEVLNRRFDNHWRKPNLVIVDGGKPQLNAAKKVLRQKYSNIKVISLAKRLEEIFVRDQSEPIRLERANPALKLIQRIRDEAHRFAITYHKNLRRKKFLFEAELTK